MIPAIKSIDHIHVFVANREAATIWYKEALGLVPIRKLEFWAKDGGPLTVADPAENVHIALFESSPVKCRSTIALSVGPKEFMTWKAHLSRMLGRELKPEDHEVSWSLYFDDPDGNPYEITTYEYEAVAQMLRTEA